MISIQWKNLYLLRNEYLQTAMKRGMNLILSKQSQVFSRNPILFWNVFLFKSVQNQWCKPDPKMNQAINQKLRDVDLLTILQKLSILLQNSGGSYSALLIFASSSHSKVP